MEHWSENFFDKITLEADLPGGRVQGWGYDCDMYRDLDALKADMANDFAKYSPRRREMTIYTTKGDKNMGISVETDKLVGEEFVNFILDWVEVMPDGD